MPTLLTAQVEAAAKHFVDDVLVAHRGVHDASARFLYHGVQAGVAHDGGDEGFVLKRAFGQHFQSANRHHVVAVNQVTGLVAEKHAVGVAIVRDAKVGAVLPDLPAHLLGVHGTAVLVDVHAIGLDAVIENLRAQFAQHARGGFVGGAVGAVHHDPHAFEGHSLGERTFGVFDVSAQRVVNADGFADGLGGRADVFYIAAEDQLFDLAFDIVVQLVTIRTEEFDPVVVIRIVRGGDHDAGVGAQAARDVSHAGRGQRSDEQHIDPHRENAGGEGVFEHVAGQPGVFADDNFVPAAAARLERDVFEDVAGGAAQSQRRLGSYRFDIGCAAHAIGAEDFFRSIHSVLSDDLAAGSGGEMGSTSTADGSTLTTEIPSGELTRTGRIIRLVLESFFFAFPKSVRSTTT